MALSDAEVKGRLSDMDTRMKSLVEGALISRGIDRERARTISFVVYHAAEGVIHALAFGEDEVDEKAVLSELARLFAAYLKEIT